jgi:hypothetical protein
MFIPRHRTQPFRNKRRAVKSAIALGFLCARIACAAPNLAVERIALHQFEDGPLLDASYEFLPAETAYFSCRLTGYQVQDLDADRQAATLSWRMEVRDPEGALLEEPSQGRINAELFPEDTNWLPKFLKSFVVPPFAVSGEYRISVRVRDEIAGSEVTGELKFRVKGHPPDSSVGAGTALTARNVVFLSNENDTLGTRSAVLQPRGTGGGTTWVRMDVSGYKFGEKNRFSLAYAMAVENAEGKQLFAIPDAGAETNESFYPQRYSIGTLTLNLDKDFPIGAYTLIVTVRDKVGNQTCEVRAPFQVQ